MALLLGHATVGKFVIKGFKFAGLDSAARISFEERGHFDFLLDFFGFALVDVAQFVVEGLFALLEGILVHLIVLFGLFEFEGRHADFEDCLSC